MKTESLYDEMLKTVLSCESALIFTHKNMDGDAAGSAKAMCLALRKLCKTAYVFAEEGLPSYLEFMESGDVFVSKAPEKYDLAIALDFGEASRLEDRETVFGAAKRSVCIDHHVGSDRFCDLKLSDSSAAACALLVYKFILRLEAAAGKALIDKDVADALYLGILTDTGSFRYSNTDEEALAAAGKLISLGADASRLCTEMYDSFPIEQLRLESLAISNAEIFCEGKACISACLLEHMESCGASPDMADSCIDRLRSIKGVEIAAVLKEREPGVYKLSLRSKGRFDVNGLAEIFGGGGHKKAAGATLRTDFTQAYLSVKREIEKILS